MNHTKPTTRMTALTIALLTFSGTTAFANKRGPEAGQYALFAYLKVLPGTEQQFMAATPEVIEESRKESGNVAYNLHQSTTDPRQFVLYEVFRTQADMVSHRSAKYVTDFLAKVNPLLVPGGFLLEEFQVLDATP